MYDVILVPAFDDNYIFLLRDENKNFTFVVDPGDGDAVDHAVSAKGWRIDGILLTHHHADHQGGVSSLKSKFNCQVYAPRLDQKRIPADVYLDDGECVAFGDSVLRVMSLPGHTKGHCGYFDDLEKKAFVGDVLFGLGCGRVFEGTYEEAFASLKKLAALPGEWSIYCAHEYTLKNAEFVMSLGSPSEDFLIRLADEKKKRSHNLYTVPLSLRRELATNPFLGASSLAEFSRLRDLRNEFK